MVAGHAVHPRADRAAVRFDPDQLQADPVVTGSRGATKQLRRGVNRIDQDINETVVIEISERATPGAGQVGNARAGGCGYVAKPSIAQVFIQHLGLFVVSMAVQGIDFGVHVPVHVEEVGPTIVIKIEESAAPTKQAGVCGQASGLRVLFKQALASIAIKIGEIVGEIGFKDIQQSVAIVVSCGNTHTLIDFDLHGSSPRQLPIRLP